MRVPLELLEDADPAPAPCGPCAAALPAPKETLIIATATTKTSFFICPSDRSLRPNLRDPNGSRPSVGHAVLTVAREWRESTPPIGHVVLSDSAIDKGAGLCRAALIAAKEDLIELFRLAIYWILQKIR